MIGQDSFSIGSNLGTGVAVKPQLHWHQVTNCCKYLVLRPSHITCLGHMLHSGGGHSSTHSLDPAVTSHHAVCQGSLTVSVYQEQSQWKDVLCVTGSLWPQSPQSVSCLSPQRLPLRAECRVRYTRASGSSFSYAATCTTESGKYDLTGSVTETSGSSYRGTVSGSGKQGSDTGHVIVVQRGKHLSVIATSQRGSARMTLTKLG